MDLNSGVCLIPVSIGEVWDKYTVLLVKKEKINDVSKLHIVNKEIEILQPHLKKSPISKKLLDSLKECNLALWEVLDKQRKMEFRSVFNDEFIRLSREVYMLNDKRFSIKNQINLNAGSAKTEVKDYKK